MWNTLQQQVKSVNKQVSAKYHLNPVFPSLCVGHWNTRKAAEKNGKKKRQQPLKGIPSEDGMPQLSRKAFTNQSHG